MNEKGKSINCQNFTVTNIDLVELCFTFSILENDILLMSGHKKQVRQLSNALHTIMYKDNETSSVDFKNRKETDQRFSSTIVSYTLS